MRIPTGTQFKALDQYTIEHEPIASINLMERAAVALADEIAKRWNTDHNIYLFAGPGNNGGDGLAVARLLSAKGYNLNVWLFNVNEKLSEDCQTNLERLSAIPQVQLTEVRHEFSFPSITTNDIVVDALFGTGLNRPLEGGFAQLIRKINTAEAPVVSIDIPSGMKTEDNSDIPNDVIVHATLTLTIQLPKLAFLLPDNEPFVGNWQTMDIHLSPEGIERTNTPYKTIEENQIAQILHCRPLFAHKGTFGHALLVAGSKEMAGAAILAANGCLRSGVGKLTVHTAAENRTLMLSTRPEVILANKSNDKGFGSPIETKEIQAMGIGPGMGTQEATAETVKKYLQIGNSPLVIDADALNILAEHPAYRSLIPQDSILTPHVKELERWVGPCTNSYERLVKASSLAIQHHIYIILKGHHTAICSPSGGISFCMAGNAGMATAGSGDVLTGILTGLLAQGYSAEEASLLGVWLHATSGDLAANELGQESLLASDLPNYLPQAFKKLKSKHNTI